MQFENVLLKLWALAIVCMAHLSQLQDREIDREREPGRVPSIVFLPDGVKRFSRLNAAGSCCADYSGLVLRVDAAPSLQHPSLIVAVPAFLHLCTPLAFGAPAKITRTKSCHFGLVQSIVHGTWPCMYESLGRSRETLHSYCNCKKVPWRLGVRPCMSMCMVSIWASLPCKQS